jgi:hypothetical protein
MEANPLASWPRLTGLPIKPPTVRLTVIQQGKTGLLLSPGDAGALLLLEFCREVAAGDTRNGPPALDDLRLEPGAAVFVTARENQAILQNRLENRDMYSFSEQPVWGQAEALFLVAAR